MKKNNNDKDRKITVSRLDFLIAVDRDSSFSFSLFVIYVHNINHNIIGLLCHLAKYWIMTTMVARQ